MHQREYGDLDVRCLLAFIQLYKKYLCNHKTLLNKRFFSITLAVNAASFRL